MAIAVLLWPAPTFTEPSRAEPFAQNGQTSRDVVLSADKANALFNLARLPSPEAPAPVPAPVVRIDPAAALKRHRLLGITINENEAVALVTDGARQMLLKEGDSLADFVVKTISPRQVTFEKDGVVAALSLP